MKTFGDLLRFNHRQCTDPLRGGMLTQERLGELIASELGSGGYSGGAIDEWQYLVRALEEPTSYRFSVFWDWLGRFQERRQCRRLGKFHLHGVAVKIERNQKADAGLIPAPAPG